MPAPTAATSAATLSMFAMSRATSNPPTTLRPLEAYFSSARAPRLLPDAKAVRSAITCTHSSNGRQSNKVQRTS
jgi:hypothetical protein